MKHKTLFIFFISMLFFHEAAGVSLAFRCGSGLVSTGDSKTKVESTCGKPSSKEKKCVETWTSKKKKCDKKVEVWYYNCGETDFIYALTFENNVLTEEEIEGRGSGYSKCQGH